MKKITKKDLNFLIMEIKRVIKKEKRVYDIEELLEILIIVNLWHMKIGQREMAKILRIDPNRISRTAGKLEKFKKRKKYG